MKFRNPIMFSLLFILGLAASSQNGLTERNYSTYCNPIDIDYTFVAHNAFTGVSYRAGADPAAVNFKGKYYMFVTRSHGYWVSNDMSNWEFITPQNWYFNGSNAPAAAVKGDEIIVAGDPSGRMAVIKTNNPDLGDWKTTYSVIPISIQDPALFVDDDGRVFLYEESSNRFPIRGVELDPENHYLLLGEQKDLFNLEPEKNGWERFGQDHSSTLAPYIEGPWMTKHNGVYYLEYGAPGTQWNVYADGVYTGKDPLGPFEYAPYNPISYKPEGFVTGAGHGSTVKDNSGNSWHFATMPISVNYKFERRIGLFPAGYEEDNGQMYVITAYGDYPHYLPDTEVEDHKERFTGWMLLSYMKEAETSTVIEEGITQKVVEEEEEGYLPDAEKPVYDASRLTDENIRTFWVANGNDDKQWATIDMGEVMNVKALQINYQEFNANIFGRVPGLRHRFVIEYSEDGNSWNTLVDYSENDRDQPHAYIELDTPTDARHIKYRHIESPNEYLAISDLRIFGNAYGDVPVTPSGFRVTRREDRRDAGLEWEAVEGAMGYALYWGIEEDKLNNSLMVYGKNSYELRALTTDQEYYFVVEAFNETGRSPKSKVLSTQTP